jgi:hypothetical protein
MQQRPVNRKHPWATFQIILYLVPTAIGYVRHYSDVISEPRFSLPSVECKLRPVPSSSFPSLSPHDAEPIPTASKL